MRVLPLLLVALALVAAGCASKTDETPTTTTPVTNTTPTTNGTAGMAMDIKSDSHTFTDVPPGATTAITVPATVTTLTLNVTFSPASSAPAGVASGVTVKLGSVSCTLPDGPVQGDVKCTKTVAATGVKQIEYSGSGPVTATVKVTGA